MIDKRMFYTAVDDGPGEPQWMVVVGGQNFGPFDHDPDLSELPRDVLDPVVISQAQQAMALAWLAEQRASLGTSGAVLVGETPSAPTIADRAAELLAEQRASTGTSGAVMVGGATTVEGATGTPTIADRASELLAEALATADAWEAAT